MSLKQIVETTDTRAARLFDIGVQVLVVISLVTFSIETLPNLPPAWSENLRRVETAVVAIFSLEYVLRVAVADRKFSFIFSFFGLVDLLAIAPFYLSLGIDLRSIRVVRLLRVFRLLKLARYSAAVRRFQRAAQIAREELVLFACVALVVLYLSAVGIYYFEKEAQPQSFASVFHSLWWAVGTLTTVGYGDVYPITVGGRIFTFVVLMVGLGIVSVPTGLFASALSKAREMESGKNGAQA
jgi:voltage-gated potassium channel